MNSAPLYLDHLFTLRYHLRDGTATIHAWEVFPRLPNGDRNPAFRDGDTHTRIDTKMRFNGKVIFPRGATWCGIPRGTTVDGKAAKELVTSLFCMKPGDTDEEYFEHYTSEQLDWVDSYSEELEMQKDARYCDPETGDVK